MEWMKITQGPKVKQRWMFKEAGWQWSMEKPENPQGKDFFPFRATCTVYHGRVEMCMRVRGLNGSGGTTLVPPCGSFVNSKIQLERRRLLQHHKSPALGMVNKNHPFMVFSGDKSNAQAGVAIALEVLLVVPRVLGDGGFDDSKFNYDATH